MALLVTAHCDRCPTRAEFNPKTDPHDTYEIDDVRQGEGDMVDVRRTIKLPKGWGVLELNVGREKDVQEICPECVKLNRSFMREPELFLPAPTPGDTEPKALPPKKRKKRERTEPTSDD